MLQQSCVTDVSPDELYVKSRKYAQVWEGNPGNTLRGAVRWLELNTDFKVH